MDPLYTILSYVGKSLFIIYLLSFAIAVYRFRLINSTVICAGWLFIMEALMNWIEPHILSFNSKEIWYGTWVLLYVLQIIFLYKIHHILKVNMIKLTNTIAYTSLVSAGIHIIRYVEREHFSGEYLDAWYYLAVNTVNISLALIVLVTVIKDRKEKLVGLYV